MSAKRTRRGRTLAALFAVFLAVLLSSGTGVASAGGPVVPIMDCYRINANGTYTVVFGYTSSATSTRSIPRGTQNMLSPSKFQGSQPTVFKPGTQRGVFSLVITQADLYGNAYWYLDGNTLNYWNVGTATECSPSTPLPAIGNGTGLAVALIGGGAFGVWFVRRLIRRSAATT